MKTSITKAELAELIKNEVRKIVGEDSLMPSPELGEPNYLSIDGPAVPVDMGDYYGDEEYMTMSKPHEEEPCPGCGQTPCINIANPLNEGGCGCGTKSSAMDSTDKMVSDILMNPKSWRSDHKDDDHHSSSYMARPQLAKIAKYAHSLLSMIEEGEQIQDWQESKIAQMAQMIGDVYHSIEYKKHTGKA